MRRTSPLSESSAKVGAPRGPGLRLAVPALAALLTACLGAALPALARPDPESAEGRRARGSAGGACALSLPAGESFRLDQSERSRLDLRIRGGGEDLREDAVTGRECVRAMEIRSMPEGRGIQATIEITPGAFRSIEQSGGRLTLLFSPPAETAPGAGAAEDGSYRIGVDDVLSISVANHDIEKQVVVDRDGRINFEYVGAVEVAGLTPVQAAKRLEYLLDKDYLVDPEVSITVKEYASQFVFVTGEVRKPGKISLREGTTLKDVLSEAGGFDREASEEVVVTQRHGAGEEPERLTFTKDQLDLGERNLTMQPGDEVTVPRRQYIYIQGEVQNPDRYPYEPGMTLLRSIAIARGLREWANRKEIRILSTENGQAVRNSYNLKDIEKQKIPDVPLKPGDIIIVPRRLL